MGKLYVSLFLTGIAASCLACNAQTKEPPAPSEPAASAVPSAPAASAVPSAPAAPAVPSAPAAPAHQLTEPGAPPEAPPAPVDAVSEASLPYEPGPKVLAEGSVDGAALRTSIAKRLKNDRSPVTVLRGGTALELGQRLCEAVVPKVPVHKPVLIRPNIGGFAWFKNPARHGGDNGVHGRTTDPAFVRGIIRCLKARGHRAITVADGWSASHKDWLRLANVSGYQAMVAEEGVSLVAMNDDGVFDVEGTKPGQPLAVTGMDKTSIPTLLMPKIIAEHLDNGLYIAAPKIKTHRFSVVSLALKGLQGVVMLSDAAPAHRQKWRSHRELNPYMAAQKKKLPEDRAAYVKALEVFAERMTDVLAVQAPHVVLAEGAPAMGGDGFHELVPLIDSVAVGGTNPIAVDRVGAELLGLWQNQALAGELGGHATSPLIEVAAARFDVDLQAVKVVGDGAELLREKRPVHFIAMAPFRLEAGTSSAGVADARNAPMGEQGAGEHGTGEPHAPEDADGKPMAHAHRLPAGAAITVDGRADEAAWKDAREAMWTTDYAGANTGIATRVRFVWSDDALYAFFELDGAGLFSDTAKPIEVEHETLYEEDCVEIFLVPDPDNLKHYYEIELGPYGHFFDMELNFAAKKKRDLSWSSGARIATTRDTGSRRVTIEVAMTAPALVAALSRAAASGEALPLGLYRIEGKKPRQYLAWSPPRTPKPKFHVPEAFGRLHVIR